MRFQLDPSSPSGLSVLVPPAVQNHRSSQGNGYITDNISGLLTAGSNVTITGNGTKASPYSIASSGGGGSGSGIVETIVAGTNVTVDSTDPANPIVSSTGGGAGPEPFIQTYNTPQATNTITHNLDTRFYTVVWIYESSLDGVTWTPGGSPTYIVESGYDVIDDDSLQFKTGSDVDLTAIRDSIPTYGILDRYTIGVLPAGVAGPEGPAGPAGDLSTVVPYTGATGPLDLGAFDLTLNQTIVATNNSGLVARAIDQATTDTNGGGATLQAGAGNGTGAGGYIQLSAGAGGATDGNGGDVYITPGVKTGAGTAGKVYVQDPTSNNLGELDLSTLTGSKTYSFPDNSGTLALTADIPPITVSNVEPSSPAVNDLWIDTS